MIPSTFFGRKILLRRWLALTLSMLVFVTLSGCGGGGGDSGTDITDDPAPPMPARVKYIVGGPGGDPNTTGFLMLDGALSITASFYLDGSYTPATKLYTLNLSPVARLVVSPSGHGFTLPVSDLSGAFAVIIEDSLQWTVGQHPVSGNIRIAAGNYIRATVNSDVTGSGVPGIDIALVEFEVTTASASLTWAEFDALLTNASAPTYQREAALAYFTLQRLYQPLTGVIQNFTTIAQQESALEAAGSGRAISVPLCTAFNASTGTFNLTWFDGPGEIASALGPGDRFAIGVNNCWLDDTSTAHDLLYVSGGMQLNNYLESTTPYTVGFNDVVFNNLAITQTEQTGPGTGILGNNTLYNTYSTVAGRDGIYIMLTADVSGTINLVNVLTIAQATATTITMPSELGNFAVNILTDALAGAALSGTTTCPVSGTYDYTLSHNPFITGATMNVTFNNCVQGTVSDQTKVNGSYLLTAAAFTSTDNLAFTLALNNITSEDDVGINTIDGPMNFARIVSAGTSNEVSSSVSGQSLNFMASGITASISNFSLSGARTFSGLTLGVPAETFTLQLSTMSDPLAGEITTTFSGPEMLALEAGAVRLSAPDGSNVLMTITDTTGAVTLALDSDGNGTAENTVNSTWSDLY